MVRAALLAVFPALSKTFGAEVNNYDKDAHNLIGHFEAARRKSLMSGFMAARSVSCNYMCLVRKLSFIFRASCAKKVLWEGRTTEIYWDCCRGCVQGYSQSCKSGKLKISKDVDFYELGCNQTVMRDMCDRYITSKCPEHKSIPQKLFSPEIVFKYQAPTGSQNVEFILTPKSKNRKNQQKRSAPLPPVVRSLTSGTPPFFILDF